MKKKIEFKMKRLQMTENKIPFIAKNFALQNKIPF